MWCTIARKQRHAVVIIGNPGNHGNHGNLGNPGNPGNLGFFYPPVALLSVFDPLEHFCQFICF